MEQKTPEFNLQIASLVELLEFRDEMHKNLTETAFGPFQVKLNAAVMFYMNLQHPVTWLSIDKFKGLDGFVSVSGIVLPIIGSSVKVSETEEITITPDNFTNFKNIARFVVPVRLLESGTKMQIMEFIRDLAGITAIATQQELEQMLKEFHFDDLDSLTSHPSYVKMLDKVTKPKEFEGFDISEFSDEKIKQLYAYSHVRPDTRN